MLLTDTIQIYVMQKSSYNGCSMLSGKKRIRSLKANIKHIPTNTKIVVGIRSEDVPMDTLMEIGFTENLESGECLLPKSLGGSVADFNSKGKYDRHTDQPMITDYRTRIWDYYERHGKKRVPKSKIVSVPFERYPRTFIEPPSIELTLSKTPSGDKIVTSPMMAYKEDNDELLHVINLYLELFGECDFFTKELDAIIDVPIKRLNWEVLPPGPIPWSELYPKLKHIIMDAKKGNRRIMVYRLQTIRKYDPDFCAIGNAGFSGYVVFGFKDKGVYVFENPDLGNATYVFDENWKVLSKKTKSEILDEHLQKDRIIHTPSWGNKINRLLK